MYYNTKEKVLFKTAPFPTMYAGMMMIEGCYHQAKAITAEQAEKLDIQITYRGYNDRKKLVDYLIKEAKKNV